MKRTLILLLAAVAAFGQRKTENVIVVMADGLRWQEVFRGADTALMTKENGKIKEAGPVKAAYWREELGARRAALMPFLWGVMAKQGVVYGNREAGSEAQISNPMNFSYPGYSETFCGWGDPRIDSNDKNYNPNPNVLEFLNKKAAFRGKVAAFGAWELFPWIFNAPRSGIVVNAGHEPFEMTPMTEKLRLLNRLKAESPHVWEGETVDVLTFHTALEYVKAKQPRVLFVGLGEPDEWAHDGDYRLYLESIRRTDGYLQELWETVQTMAQYRGKTTLIVLTDHGRGAGPQTWKDHGQKVPESREIWMALLGPDTPALGERKNVAPVIQGQVAATVAALLGEDYTAAEPKAKGVLSEAVKK